MSLRDSIGGPREAHGVGSAEEYVAKARRALAARGRPTELRLSDTKPAAYVSDSRWVIDCPNCRNGPSASRAWGIAVCFRCGTLSEPVFPADADDVEEVLLARPLVEQRHYFCCKRAAARVGLASPETVADLEAENTAKKLPRRRGKVLLPGKAGAPAGLVLPGTPEADWPSHLRHLVR